VDGFIKITRRHPVKGGQISVQHDLLSAHEQNGARLQLTGFNAVLETDVLTVSDSSVDMAYNTFFEVPWGMTLTNASVVVGDGQLGVTYACQFGTPMVQRQINVTESASLAVLGSQANFAIGYATSNDGISWKRMSDRRVLQPEAPWEKVAVMCPHVLWDPQTRLFRMWYSGGEQNEPNAIGYATSPDGLRWTKCPANPIFTPDPANPWEKHKVTACQVIRQGEWYLMFYIGFRGEPHAQIGLARSKDGVRDWQRHPANPIIRAGLNQWDHDACYKPYAIFDRRQWLLWYNGRHGSLEQIGVALHPGEDLGF
jgi:hypothetical protein